MNNLPELLTLEQVSEALGLARQTLYNQINPGKLPFPHMKLGRALRVRKDDLEAYLLENLTPANTMKLLG